MTIEQITLFINAAANIATIIGVLIVWLKERKTKEDVTDLRIVANQLIEQNSLLRERIELQLLELKAEANADWGDVKMDTYGQDNSIVLRIVNEGGVA